MHILSAKLLSAAVTLCVSVLGARYNQENMGVLFRGLDTCGLFWDFVQHIGKSVSALKYCGVVCRAVGRSFMCHRVVSGFSYFRHEMQCKS